MKANWDIYDWLDLAEKNEMTRRCPKCEGEDVKFAIHNKATAGVELSVRCNECRHEDSGDNSGEDVARLVREWHEGGIDGKALYP